jgi:elongation factor P--beta-lysine ligase
MRLLRRRSAVTPLDEAAAYARCHGTRDNDVRVVKLPPRRERYDVLATGEELRRLFEERLDAREPDERYSRGGPARPAPPPAVPPAA